MSGDAHESSAEAPPTPSGLAPGDLVVVPRSPELGLCRLERWLVPTGGDARGSHGQAQRVARLFLLESGRFVQVPADDVRAAPPGVWPPVLEEREG